MQVEFESDFQKKILSVSFKEGTVFKDKSDLDLWKKLWMEELKAWHSPYKALINFSNVTFSDESEAFFAHLKKMFDFLERFFLRKSVAWGLKQIPANIEFPFEVVESEEEACKVLGLRERVRAPSEDFRSLIRLDNHFEQKNVELSFLEPVILTKEKVAILRSKMTNNLMLWHSHWKLLIDCHNLEIPAESHQGFESMVRFLKGFFLEDVVGYSPLSKDLSYPFSVFRSRHKAAAQVKSSGTDSGRDAHCKK